LKVSLVCRTALAANTASHVSNAYGIANAGNNVFSDQIRISGPTEKARMIKSNPNARVRISFVYFVILTP
jgi:hypothetical protein